MRLRSQLLIFGLGPTAVLSTLSIVALILLQTITMPTVKDNLRRKTEMSIRSLAALDVALATHDIAVFSEAVDALAVDKDLRFVQVLNSEGSQLYAYGRRPVDAKDFPEGTIRQSKGFALGSQSVVLEGLSLGRVELAYSASAIDTLRKWIRVLSLVALLLVLASVFISIRTAYAVVSPISAMIDFMKEVKKGNLAGRVQANEGASEMRMLSYHLNVVTHSIHQRDIELAKQQEKLEVNLQTIHETREQLLRSTRLAAVGEMAGRTAHEVLNPVASIQGRLVRILEARAQASDDNAEVIREILSCWKEDYQDGGFEKLLSGFSVPCEGDSPRPLFEEDLENLGLFVEGLEGQDSEFQDDLGFLLKEIGRITHIVDGMRSMTRSSGTAASHDVADVLRESVDILQDGFKKRSIVADIDCSAGLLVHLDRYELIQVTTNLMRNSMLAIEEDRGRAGGRISLRAKSVDEMTEILVSDDGPGIAEEHKPFLFESNFTTRSSSDGTGLGLAIARRLVRGVEGDLSLHSSEIGVGTAFLIELPRAPSAVHSTQASETENVAA
ncbi:MAG: HAMP domain-containing histidine kinase [Myxococcales bacterium]|nr:HAMP domain-containing histidine kinase [Myxococcales bacterium]